jgi:surface protein
MFRYCASLESIPLLNTSQATNFSNMFYACKKIKVLPAIDTSKGNLLEYFCHSCISLEEFLGFNTRNATYFNGMFYSCENLVSVELDMRNATSATSIFTGNESLTNLVLKNIKTNVQIGKGSNEYNAWGTLLTVDSLVNTCYELRDTGSQKTLTMGSANLEKLANVYVREIPITDAMREADDLIDEKLPFERCESTDEGATLISDYVLLKNWKLA